jgi:hypothetical protein
VAATQVHQIVPSTEDPVLRFFADIDLCDIVITQPPGWPQNAIETRADDRGVRGYSAGRSEAATALVLWYVPPH